MEPLFSIGEMAKKSQLSIQRLRYYDKIGLLVPAFT
ncbi:MerR family DNA-binding transcriptional regulator, partial [Listeria monocytogenes]|nr:MerR family DNA-binding transcriptional regulator [Listeria monocytogenes]